MSDSKPLKDNQNATPATSGTRGDKRSTGRPQKVTDSDIEEALRGGKGIVSGAAAWLFKKRGIQITRSSLYARIAQSPHLQEVRHEVEEETLDFAESQLFKKMMDGDKSAIFFYLKCKGKARGYIERGEITGKDGGVIEISDTQPKADLSKLSDEELKQYGTLVTKIYRDSEKK